MANRQVQVDLMFNANTQQAKQQLNDLKGSLDSLSRQSSFDLPMGKQLNQAQADVAKLQTALERATDSAGKLDIGKFYNQLKQMDLTSAQVKKSLESLGPAGAKSFQQLTVSITNAQVETRKLGGLIKDFSTTLKNTLKWQVSSSVLNSLTGVIQSAIGYSKDLNKSFSFRPKIQ